jgi:hydrogenase-4 component B
MNVVIAGFAALALAMVLDIGGQILASARPTLRRPLAFRSVAALTLLTVAALVFAVAGGRALAGHGGHARLTWLTAGLQLPGGPEVGDGLVLDRLAGLFLLLVFSVAIPALLVVIAWHRRLENPPASLPSSLALMLGACAGVVLAGDLFVLLLSWELLTASFYWIVVLQRCRPGRIDAGIVAVGFGKLSGAALLLGSVLVVANSNSLALSRLGEGRHGFWWATGYALIVLAFAVKVGLVPVHVWMPRAYSAAPGPVRALMAGAAVNAGFYGLWRTLDVLGPPPGWLAVTVLLLGGITALLGIAHATIQTRLSGVVAYSSVENAGLICAAYGVSLIGAVTGRAELVGAGLLAATLQVIAHAIAKSLLFASAGTIESTLDSDDMDAVRGAVRRMPWTGTGLAVGALVMAGLPPTALFVSEWFILESLMQQFRLDDLGYTLPLAATGALVALTAGFAGVAFARLAAFTALGRSPRPEPAVPDLTGVGRAGIAVLITACFAIAILTPAEIHLLATGLSSIVSPPVTDQAVASPFVLGPVYRQFSTLSPSWLALELPLMAGIVFLVALALSRGRLIQVRRVEPWRSATGGVDGADEYTPFGYANPTRKVLANILLTRTELWTLEARSGGTTGDEDAGPAGAHLGYSSDVVEITEAYLYRPLIRPLRRLVTAARSLQSGRLDAYLLYMLVALVAVLLGVAVTN